MIIRDPIHNIIQFDKIKCGDLLVNLINCKEFQRLRRIKQLGMSDLVFPGATHTRFIHSIGVMYVAKMFLDQLKTTDNITIDDDKEKVVLCAALLHDIGHGPFSHAFEKVTGAKHEKITIDLIKGDTQICQKLQEKDEELPQKIVDFLTDENWATYIVTSQFDADRCDYLLRDGHASGADYGRFDLYWLIKHLHVHVSDSRDTNSFLYFDRKSFFALEQYILARYHMYQAVYFHKTTRAAEVMLRLFFSRCKELIREDRNFFINANIPKPLLNTFTNTEQATGDFLALDDYTIIDFIKNCSKNETSSKDKVISYLSDGLLYRKLYKCIQASDTSEADTFYADARDVARKWIKNTLGEEIASSYFLAKDSIADIPYKPFNPVADPEKKPLQIYIESDQHKFEPINQVSEVVKGLQDKYGEDRYYFPFELHDEIDKLVNK